MFGLSNDGTALNMTGYVATAIFDGVKAGHKFDMDSIKDELKFDASLIAFNPYLELTITWTPTAATRVLAAAAAVILAPLAKVTLTHFAVAAINGDYVYVGDEELNLSQGPAKMSIKIRKYDNATQNTALTTTVTG